MKNSRISVKNLSLDTCPQDNIEGKWYQYVAGVTACTSILAVGAWYTWPAPLVPRLLAPDSPVPMTPEQLSWVVSSIEAGALFSPFPATIIADRYGRKFCLLISTPLFLLGFFLTVYIKTFTSLCTARFIFGLGNGIPYTVLPMYLGEIASPNVRGIVTSFYHIFFGLGCLFPYLIGPYLSYDALSYATVLLNILFVGCFVWQPESPYYYAMREKPGEASQALIRLRQCASKNSIQKELEAVQLDVKRCLEEKASWKDIVKTKADRRALLLIIILGIVSFSSGQNAILTYTTETFTEFPNNLMSPDFVTIGIGIVALLGSVLSLFISDSLGRRFLLLSSGMGCTISLLIASAYFYLASQTQMDVSSISWLAPVAVMLFNLFVAGGMHPVFVTYSSELFPTDTRGLVGSLSNISLGICCFLVIKVYNFVTSLIGVYFIYLCYSTICLIGTVLFYFMMPETMGKTFMEIRETLNKL